VIVGHVQRWTERRGSRRPAGEVAPRRGPSRRRVARRCRSRRPARRSWSGARAGSVRTADLCEPRRFGGLPQLVGRAIHHNVRTRTVRSIPAAPSGAQSTRTWCCLSSRVPAFRAVVSTTRPASSTPGPTRRARPRPGRRRLGGVVVRRARAPGRRRPRRGRACCITTLATDYCRGLPFLAPSGRRSPQPSPWGSRPPRRRQVGLR